VELDALRRNTAELIEDPASVRIDRESGAIAGAR
jgi:hypothetical protein